MEIRHFPDEAFKVIVSEMLTELWRQMAQLSENIHKETENIFLKKATGTDEYWIWNEVQTGRNQQQIREGRKMDQWSGGHSSENHPIGVEKRKKKPKKKKEKN